MAIKHKYQTATPNNPAEEISSDEWNDVHTLPMISVSAAGTDAATATNITQFGLVVVTAGSGGIRLPAGVAGDTIYVRSDVTLNVYPPAGATITAGNSTGGGSVVNIPTQQLLSVFYLNATTLIANRSARFSTDLPQALGTAATGTSDSTARVDHVHPMPTLTQVSTYLNVLATGAHLGLGRAPVDNTTFTSLSMDGTSGAIMDFYANGALRGRSFAGTGSMAFSAVGASTFLRFDTNSTERLRFEANGAWGLAGANYGTAGQVLTSNGSAAAPTWQTVSGGGGGPTITFPEQGTAPAAPAADNGIFYAFDQGGRTMPTWRNPLDSPYPLAAHRFFKNGAYWRGGNGATATSLSIVGSMPFTAVASTTTTPALASTNILTQSIRSRYSTSTTAGNVTSVRTNTPFVHRGSVAGLGGFHIGIRFAFNVLNAVQRSFHGIWSGTANPGNVAWTTDTATGRIGIVTDSNTGNLRLAHNTQGTAPTLIDLGATMPLNITDMYELILYCGPNASSVTYKVTNMNTGAVVTGTLSTNLPANTQFLGLMTTMTNNTAAAAVTYDFVAGFVESNT
jgi:hypothetical protein